MSEQEEFEFRLRLEQEQAKTPLTREQLISQIPSGGNAPPVKGEAVEPRSLTQSAIEGAMAVPVLAGGARGLQMLSKGSKVAPYVGNLAASMMPTTGKALLAEGGIGALSGVGAELAARGAPKEWGPLAEIGGGMAGGMAGAMAGSAMRNIGTAVTNAQGLFSSTKDLANQVSNLAGAGRASAQAITALSANPNLAGSIGRASEIETNTGIKLPMLAASNGDTTISSFLQSQISKGDNSVFTAQIKQQYEAAEKALTQAKRGVAPSMTEVDAYVKKKALDVAATNAKTLAAGVAASKARLEGKERIDERIVQLSNELQQAPGLENIGARLSSLLDAKSSAIRSELSPQYTKLLTESSDAGIKLPAAAAKDLRDYALDARNQDLFADHPSLLSDIRRVFRPTTDTTGKIAGKYKQAVRSETEAFDDYALKDIDSLKRSVNKAIRETKDVDKLRRLGELRKQVDGAVDQIDPVFAAPYRALDKEYATRLGIPFSEQGVVNIDRAKFVENTVPALTKNASSLKQAMAAVGNDPQGIQIITDAFLYDIGNNRSIINTATGELNPAQLQRYLAKNKEKFDLVPGLRDSLEATASRVGTLRDNRTAILEAEKNAKIDKISSLWSQAYEAPNGIRGVVQSALKTPAELEKLLLIAGKDRVAKEGIKSAILEDMLTAQGNRMDILTENKAALERIFGKNETKQLGDIVEASQRLKDNPFKMSINLGTISKTRWQDLTGTKIETSLGEARNQVLSMQKVFINHFGRYFTGQANKNEAVEVQKFLLNPDALKDAAAMMTEINTRGFTERALGLSGKLAKNSASAWLMGATVGAGIGAQERQQETYQPTDATLLEGFEQ
jgi:hypothetical protein